MLTDNNEDGLGTPADVARTLTADLLALCLEQGPAPGAQLTAADYAEQAAKRTRRRQRRWNEDSSGWYSDQSGHQHYMKFYADDVHVTTAYHRGERHPSTPLGVGTVSAGTPSRLGRNQEEVPRLVTLNGREATLLGGTLTSRP